jgi:hypothetical protein
MLVGTAIQTARHGILRQSASAPTLLAAPPCGPLERKAVDPLGRCRADHDSGRRTGQRDFYPKDASF